MTFTDSVTSPTCHGQVHALAGIHIDDDVGGDGFREPGRLRGNRVSAYFDLREEEIAVVVGGGLGLDSGFLIGQSDGCFGDHRTLWIADGSQHIGGLKLREARCNCQKTQ